MVGTPRIATRRDAGNVHARGRVLLEEVRANLLVVEPDAFKAFPAGLQHGLGDLVRLLEPSWVPAMLMKRGEISLVPFFYSRLDK